MLDMRTVERLLQDGDGLLIDRLVHGVGDAIFSSMCEGETSRVPRPVRCAIDQFRRQR